MNNRKNEILGILLCIIALFIFASFLTYNPLETPSTLKDEIAKKNIMGVFGVYVSYYLMKFTFGWGSFFFPTILGIFGYILFTNNNQKKLIGLTGYIVGIGIWCSVFLAYFGRGKSGLWEAEYPGLVGYVCWNFLLDIFGFYPSIIILFTGLILLVSGIMNISLYVHFKKNSNKVKQVMLGWIESRRLKNVIRQTDNCIENKNSTTNDVDLTESEELEVENDKVDIQSDVLQKEVEISNVDDQNVVKQDQEALENTIDEGIAIDSEIDIAEGDLDAQKERQTRYRQYKLPTLDYLYDPVEITNQQSQEELKDKASQLIHALETYGVSGRVVRISPGPIITLFEIEPAEGVRVNKFTNLSDDLARVMRAQRVRIIAPIPGSKSVGIELPNHNPATVYLKNIINSEQFIESESKLSVSLGKTTTGEAYVFDLGKMPHLLVAGATGAGKSVCINTIIVSILYKAKPDEVKFILMDPKKLELATYKSLVDYHLITAPNLDEYVMTTAENSVAILDSAIVEMERRFQVFSDARVRNISEYHDRRSSDLDLEPIPFLVVVIDELADLMMTSGRAIEEPITRLAQKARAVGIHLVVATQRPSVDVITGLIKSNFPARIAFQVSSKIDSRTIIDQMGAEKLLGRGDMLFLLPGTASPIRIHNAYITLDEIEAIMAHIESQPKPEKLNLPETRKEKVAGNFNLDEEKDELLQDAATLVTQNQQASVSLLQRKFRIGYSRAGRLIDELETLGIVSGYSGSKAREVLVDESYLSNIFNE